MIIIKVNIKKVNSMEKVNIVGQMDHLMKETLSKDLGMGKEAGNLQEKEVIFIQEVMKMIKSVDMGAMFGLMVVFIKAILKTT